MACALGREYRVCGITHVGCRSSDMPVRDSRSDLLIRRPVEILWTSGGIPVDKLSAQIFFHVARAVFDRTAHCVCGFAPTFA